MPASVLQMIVEPSQQDLLRRQSQELLQGLAVLQQTVQLRVQLDVNLAQQSPTNDLPDQTQHQMLAHFDDVS